MPAIPDFLPGDIPRKYNSQMEKIWAKEDITRKSWCSTQQDTFTGVQVLSPPGKYYSKIIRTFYIINVGTITQPGQKIILFRFIYISRQKIHFEVNLLQQSSLLLPGQSLWHMLWETQ